MMIHISRDGQSFGPYTVEEARAYLVEGSLAPSDMAWQEGAAEWVPLEQLVGGAAPVRAKSKMPVIAVAVAGVLLVFGGLAFGLGWFSGGDEGDVPAAAGGNSNSKPSGKSGGSVLFADTAGPVFERNRCYNCHHTAKSNKAEGGLDFADLRTIRGFVLPNEPGNFDTAPLVLVLTPGAEEPMPPNGARVSKADIEIIKAWIAAGAKF